MKTTKRIFTLALCLIMMMCLATSVFAVDLTIQGEKSGHTYYAYQIFSGTINDKGVMSDIQWGSGIKDGAALLAAMKADTTKIYNEANEAEFTTLADQFAAAKTAEDVANVMKNWGDNAARIDYFADFIYKHHLSTTHATSTEGTGNQYSFNVNPGYYMIMDEPGSLGTMPEDDFYSKIMVDLSTSQTISVKGSFPAVTKRVSANLDSGYNSYISNQLNKVHYYEWVGTLPSDIQDYAWYYYEFEDMMSGGLTFDDFEEIYIESGSGAKTWILDKSNTHAVVAALRPTGMEVDTTPGFDADTTDALVDGTATYINLKWDDLAGAYKTVTGANLLSSDKIVVRYSAHLNIHAVVGGDGNQNKVTLIYSNNPHDTDDKGKTPPADPRVYTFKMLVNKVDTSGNPLKGAEFYLYHYHVENHYDAGGNFTGSTNVPMYAIIDANHKITGWTETMTSATKLTTAADGIIKAEGLKSNVGYYLKEVKAPDGYNKLAYDPKLEILPVGPDSDTKFGPNGYTLTSVEYQVEGAKKVSYDATGEVTFNVENKAGTELPSTGGVGTTMFYIAGGLMVALAVVLLVTKKRMAEEQ